MDTKWLIGIVIAAVIAQLIKELTSAVIKRAPAMTSRLAATLTPMMSRFISRYWRILVDLFGMASVVVGLMYLISTLGPVTHGSVFVVGIFSAWFVYWQFELIRDIRRLTDAA